MAFIVRPSVQTAGDRTGEVYELLDSAGTVRAEVWPQWGFNCLRWQVRQPDGRWGDLLYCAPDWAVNPVPTRSGHPILFPFPGRIRHGAFSFEGRTFTLPHNDSTQQHAIHGFTPRNPWRVTDFEEGKDSGRLTGQFHLSQDLPSAHSLWPSDFRLTVSYVLLPDRLQVEAAVVNLGPRPLPFGLGYHPYFRLPSVVEDNIDGLLLQAHVNEVWEAEGNLPTGERSKVTGPIDFRQSRPIGDTSLDHVFTRVIAGPSGGNGLTVLAELSHENRRGRLQVCADASFRELVLFTPPHRHAIAIEPYTCSADAANLATRGINSGWGVIAPNDQWSASVEYHWLRDC